MGVSLSWIAIEGTRRDVLLDQLGLSETGEQGFLLERPIAGLMLPSGWYLLAVRGCDHPILSDKVLRDLSSSTSVVACSVEEHIMYASATLWRDGLKVWSVRHNGGDHGVMDLTVDGVPPSGFDRLRSEFFSKQAAEGGESAGVDLVFEIPLELAKSLAGFKHDDAATADLDGSFRALKPNAGGVFAQATKPWWKIW